MSYIVGQYNHNSNSGDDSSYITLIKSGTAARRTNSGDYGVLGGAGLNPFTDECVKDLTLSTSNYYYFSCQIKRMTSQQVFSIKLVNYDTTTTGAVEQFLKTVIIQGGDREEWVSVEVVFHPVIQFDCILFQLQRSIDDYRVFSRYPKIAYQELGIINNIIESQIGQNVELLKIGVQSHPGLVACINGEEIHTSRSGIYEIKNGVIPVKFFSIITPAAETTNVLDNWISEVNTQIETIENSSMSAAEKEAAYAAINSVCFFYTDKQISIDPFTLDYTYEE